MECSPSKRRLLLIISVLFLVLGLVGLIILCILFALSVNVGNMNAVVLDAGSTSTKLTLYEWKDYPFRTNGAVKQIKEAREKPGISSYINEPFQAYEKLAGPLQNLVADIPQNERSKVPVYLAATAGMRLELIKSPLASMDLFDVIRRGLLNSGLAVETPNERIRMLSGSEEGLFGWVSVNNILGTVTEETQLAPEDTVGSLDLGGASTQISFVAKTEPPSREASMDYYPLKLFGRQYTVYSHSFLCYGKNEFEKRIQGSIIGTNTNASIENPCLLKGYKINASAATIYDSPCITGTYAESIFTEKLSKPAGLESFTFVGTGSPNTCRDVVKKQFKTGNCTIQPCSFNGVHQPQVTGVFRAYSGFSYAMAHLFPQKVTGFTKSEIENSVYKFCNKTWSEVANETDPKQLEFVYNFCYDGIYILELLTNFGFKTDESWKAITFGAKINDQSVSWALGYMLDQSGFLPSESPKVSSKRSANHDF
ncbi:Ectonucleoside triphosphate diphosphohydrolase [Paragonimus heterotremus]|uniref:Ectonucleoside triphosphate diphosphohydrolase n=1 Tax=Paragonimus heterotremus TaxID=100268 RepID=A0A8J4TMF5_9TREM|nr:Ectonucleoside triphosphate diphosphohydrolase [Paragonimus heterotremus]